MIKHVVCYKFKDDIENVREKSKEVLMSMRGKVPQVVDIEVGIDFLASPRSYDLVLSVTFDSAEAMEEYQKDEYHVSVVKKHMHSVVDKSVAVDYNME